ncbi:MAG: DUF1775 domain-containing protein [Ilumatobacteraceae bacterium]
MFTPRPRFDRDPRSTGPRRPPPTRGDRGAPDTEGELFFKVIQGCADGEDAWIDEWDGTGTEPESPTPSVLSEPQPLRPRSSSSFVQSAATGGRHPPASPGRLTTRFLSAPRSSSTAGSTRRGRQR